MERTNTAQLSLSGYVEDVLVVSEFQALAGFSVVWFLGEKWMQKRGQTALEHCRSRRSGENYTGRWSEQHQLLWRR